MYPPTRNARHHSNAITDPPLPAFVGTALAIGLLPVAVASLASHLALGGGLLLGLGIVHRLVRRDERGRVPRRRSSTGRPGDPPRRQERRRERQQATRPTRAD